MHPYTTPHAPTHARPGLPVTPDPNPTPAEEAISRLHYTAAIWITDKSGIQLLLQTQELCYYDISFIEMPVFHIPPVLGHFFASKLF